MGEGTFRGVGPKNGNKINLLFLGRERALLQDSSRSDAGERATLKYVLCKSWKRATLTIARLIVHLLSRRIDPIFAVNG
jgi:hypothetical protein